MTRVTHLVARVFVWCSLRRAGGRLGWGGPSLRQRRFPGREQREGRRVPTTLPNRSHRSPLAGRCVTAETRHSPCGADRCVRPQGGGVLVASACVCVYMCVFLCASGKRTKRSAMMSATGEFHSALSFLQICRGWRTREAAAALKVCARALGSLTFLAFVFTSCSTNPKTGVHKQCIFFIHIGK